MKVIAKIDGSRVLCEVTIEELAFLHGFRTAYDNGFNRDQASLVGSECNLKKMVATSQFVRGLRPDTLKKAKEGMEKIISQLDDTIEIVGSLEIFNILNEEKQIGDS
jgi:hypothetical protein